MKIIKVDNFCRDNRDDVLIAENIKNKYYGEKIVNLLNSKESVDSEDYFKLVEDDYKLYEFEY